MSKAMTLDKLVSKASLICMDLSKQSRLNRRLTSRNRLIDLSFIKHFFSYLL